MTLKREPIIIRTHFNHPPLGGFVNTMPSMTTQDDTMSIEELYKKFGHGDGPVQLGRQLFYDGVGEDLDVNDCYIAGQHWESLDIVERQNILKIADNDFVRINDGIKKANQEKAKKLEEQRKEEQKQKEEFQKWMKKQNASSDSPE